MSDLYEPKEQWASYLINALKAKELHFRDVNYIVRKGEVRCLLLRKQDSVQWAVNQSDCTSASLFISGRGNLQAAVCRNKLAVTDLLLTERSLFVELTRGGKRWALHCLKSSRVAAAAAAPVQSNEALVSCGPAGHHCG